MKRKNVNLDYSLDVRDNYIHSIIYIYKRLPKHKIIIVSWAVKTVDNSLTWCGLETYIQ